MILPHLQAEQLRAGIVRGDLADAEGSAFSAARGMAPRGGLAADLL